MKSQRLPMSWQEYELIENPFGWKVEYGDGQARFSPREMGITTHLDLTAFSLPETSQPASIQSGTYNLVPISEAYKEQIIDGYFATFVNSVEFCDWPIKSINESAHRDITRYFAGKRGKQLSASVIALAPDTQQLIGLALFTEKEEHQASLELLYVRFPHQRQGIGTAMLHYGIQRLMQENYQQLTSRYHICNHHSRQFYHKIGFQDIYEAYALRIKIGWLKQEIWRKEKLKMLDGLELLRREKEALQAEMEILNEQGFF